LTIFFNNMKRLLRNKVNLTFMIIVPVVLISVISGFGIDRGRIRCGVIDLDGTPLTQALIEDLEVKFSVSEIDESDIEKKIFGQYLDVVVVIDEGFTGRIINGEEAKIKTVSLQETDISVTVNFSIENFVNAAINIAGKAGGNEELFYQGFNIYRDGIFGTQSLSIDNGNEKTIIRAQLGFLVMGMLFMNSFGAMIMLEDKQTKVYYRILSGPVKVSDYMLQCLGSFFTLAVLQILLLFLFMAGLLKVDFGPDILSLFAVSLIFSLCCVSLGVLINTVSKDMRQSGVISSLVLTPICMLGGAWWPMEFMPEILRKVGLFVPVTWVMRAYEKLLYGRGIEAIAGEIGVMLVFSVLFLLFASWRRVDVAK
jgi:ABC-2 type transport system permease protein